MHLQSLTRRLAAVGLIGALALILAFAGGTLAAAQSTPSAATPAVGGDTALPDTGAGTTANAQATPAVGGDTALPDTGDGSSISLQATPAVGGLLIVLAAAAAVVVAAVSARTFARRNW